MRDIDSLILELVNYALMNELIEEDDKIYVTNRLLEVFEKIGLDTDSDVINGDVDSKKYTTRRISEILSDCLEIAIKDGLIEDTQLNRDIFDTKIMGVLTPMPSVVRKHFKELYNNSPKLLQIISMSLIKYAIIYAVTELRKTRNGSAIQNMAL